MRWILWSIAGLVAIVGLVVLVGWMLPVSHEASSSAYFSQSPAQVYETVADVAEYASWLEGVSEIEMLGAPNGKTRFRQHANTGPVVMEIDEARPSSRFVTRIADPDQPFGGTWTFDFTPEGNGSRLTITERGEVYNPLFRYMARYVFGYTATMEGYLRSLKRRLGR